jgi:quercetin dioxygenase-like cupin family protein
MKRPRVMIDHIRLSNNLKLISIALACVVVLPATIVAQAIDPVAVSPEMYKVLLENDQARVVEYTIRPGERDQPHTHPPKVSYVLAGGTLRITPDGGSPFTSVDSTGKAVWMNAVPRHFAANIGAAPVRIILVEIRGAGGQAAPHDKDPAVVNPSSISVKLENDSVRVMVADIPPGFKEKEHTHPPYVMYILNGGSVRMHIADGTTRDAELKPGMALFSDSVTHWAENTGNTTIKVLLVEIRKR